MTAPALSVGIPVVAPVGGDESRPCDLVDGELADDGLAADRLGNRHAQHATARHAGVSVAAGVGATVGERRDPGIEGDGVDVDDQGRRSQRVEADVAVVVGLDDQPVGGERGDRGVVVEVGAGDAAVAVGGDPVVTSEGGDEPGTDDLVDGELADDGLAAERFRHRDLQDATTGDAPDRRLGRPRRRARSTPIPAAPGRLRDEPALGRGPSEASPSARRGDRQSQHDPDSQHHRSRRRYVGPAQRPDSDAAISRLRGRARRRRAAVP